jgi:hypothetical protein
VTTIMEGGDAGLNAKRGQLAKTACRSLWRFSQHRITKGAISLFSPCALFVTPFGCNVVQGILGWFIDVSIALSSSSTTYFFSSLRA